MKAFENYTEHTHPTSALEYDSTVEAWICTECLQQHEMDERLNNIAAFEYNEEELKQAVTLKALFPDESELIQYLSEPNGISVYYSGYAEPEYDADDQPIFVADWNNYNTLADILQSLNYNVEWHDEWTTCQYCCRLVRTMPNSYSWTAYYTICDSELICADCITDGFEDYLPAYANNPETAISFDIDLTDYGFEKYDGQFESGWHRGQDSDPHDVMETLENEYDEIVFKIDYNAQFSVGWSVWTR